MNIGRSRRRSSLLPTLLIAAGLAAVVTATASPAAAQRDRLSRMKHFVVIYEENHSFDNLYGGWEGVNGRPKARAAHTVQRDQFGHALQCLPQVDVNLTAPDPLSSRCAGTNPTNGSAYQSHFFNAPFQLDTYIPASAKTCPDPAVSPANGVRDPNGFRGGCTRDLVHRYYQEQYQLDGGRQDRYTTASDALGLTQGYYATRQLPIYKYLHRKHHPRYAIADDFFQSAFGGSFLNHQWLVAARTPFWPSAPTSGADDLHSITDTNGMPTSYPLYMATGTVKDSSLTEACPSTPAQHVNPPRDPAHGNVVCGDWAVNTTQPLSQPYSPGTAVSRRLPTQDAPTIGDRLSAAHTRWAWYSGGWSNADGRVGDPGWTNNGGPVTRTNPADSSQTNSNGCPDPNSKWNAPYPFCADNLFQFHHQSFNYFTNYARMGPNGNGAQPQARMDHLRDEQEFIGLAQSSRKRCKLRAVSFIKPLGAENEHPGYASVAHGSSHLVSLLRGIEKSACRKDTMVVVTYDEFGGAWDHVSPPGQVDTRGPSDAWGPGTRIPALVVSPGLRGKFVVDHTTHDTTSIIATIEHRYRLKPVATRDARVRDLASVYSAHEPRRRRSRG